jgi:hypothetical protein
MRTRFGIGGAAIIAATFMLTTSARTQMVASHAPAVSSTKADANAKPATMAPAMSVSGKAVARVNGVELIDRDLLREMFTIFPYAQQHNGFPKELEPEIRRGALQMIIFEELVYQEAKRRNMTVSAAKLSAAEAEFRRQFPTQAAYNDFLKTEANGSQAVVREKIRRSMLIDQFMDQDVNNASRITLA